MKCKCLAVAILSIVGLGLSHAAYAAPPASHLPLICHKAKLAAVGKFTNCLYKQRGKTVLSGGSPNMQPCVDKLVTAFGKAEEKAAGNCHVLDDASAVAAQAALAFLQVDASLVADAGCLVADPGMCFVPDPSACPELYGCSPGYLSASLGVDACFCRTPPGLD
jgi:hypothetical protein